LANKIIIFNFVKIIYMDSLTHELITLSTLERKEKRLAFLRELYSNGVESVYRQMDRTCDEVAIMKIEIYLEERKNRIDSNINSVLNK
jgi:hypothetical protein